MKGVNFVKKLSMTKKKGPQKFWREWKGTFPDFLSENKFI